ncbi:hypothetical protein GGR01_000756 [Acetobacter oeni]|nr:hypothetical protein [Acetobacter oeni]
MSAAASCRQAATASSDGRETPSSTADEWPVRTASARRPARASGNTFLRHEHRKRIRQITRTGIVAGAWLQGASGVRAARCRASAEAAPNSPGSG